LGFFSKRIPILNGHFKTGQLRASILPPVRIRFAALWKPKDLLGSIENSSNFAPRRGRLVEEQTAEILGRFDQELQRQSLSLENSIRITVWGRHRAARTAATVARAKVFSGMNRVASSSFIAAERFDSQGDAALELLVLKPLKLPALREPVDFAPARNYLRYLRYDSWLFFSGFTSAAATLELQVADILDTLQNAFSHARTDWGKVVKLSVFLQRGRDWNAVRDALIQPVEAASPAIDCRFVDGFAGEKYLLEVEATALA
jgi:enamine deaminase RidA (YjgF/YER057c/UK114 family)